MNPIKKAADLVGTQQELADKLGIHPSFVSQMISGHRKVPPTLCRRIEMLTRGLVKRAELRPDIFADAEDNRAGAKNGKPAA